MRHTDEGIECILRHNTNRPCDTKMYCALLEQTNSDCIIEGGLLTQVQTHAMETLGPINLAVL